MIRYRYTEELAVWMPTGIGKELRRCRVPSNMASDLEGFSAIDVE